MPKTHPYFNLTQVKIFKSSTRVDVKKLLLTLPLIIAGWGGLHLTRPIFIPTMRTEEYLIDKIHW